MPTTFTDSGHEVAFGFRKPAKSDLRDYPLLRFKDFVRAVPYPAAYSVGVGVAGLAQNYGNAGPGAFGDCLLAFLFHQLNCWTRNNGGGEYIPTRAQALAVYQSLTGYNPATGANDTGLSFAQLYQYASTTGLPNGDKVIGYWVVDPDDPDNFRRFIWMFGGAGPGFGCPNAWVASARSGAVWDVAPVNWDQGHGLLVYGYHPIGQGVIAASWGFSEITITDPACVAVLGTQASGQCFVGITPGMVVRGMQTCPNGMTWWGVVAALQGLTGGPLQVCPAVKGLVVFLPPRIVAGQQFSVTVSAADAGNQTVIEYAGETGLTISGNNLSEGFTNFMAAGLTVIPATIAQPGSFTGVVNVPVFGPQFTATVTLNVEAPVPPIQLFVAPPTLITHGQPFGVGVSVLDANGGTVQDFSGTLYTVVFGVGTDAGSIENGNVTADMVLDGVGSYSVTFRAVGTDAAGNSYTIGKPVTLVAV